MEAKMQFARLDSERIYMFENEKVEERLILVAAFTGTEEAANESLDELEELVETAGAVAVGRVTQARDSIHPGTYVGKGKLEDIKTAILAFDATGIVCDDELSPAQIRNLEQELDTKIMDRTCVILDIFAGRAQTAEGKIQVELAQHRYMLARLVGMRTSLSRLGGGIGTRGPGEKKLEMDRRLIKNRISHLKKELAEVQKNREVNRQQRKRNQMPVVAIVGYTNAGKSTLLNQLTGAGVLEEDKLFATLDPTTRSLQLENKQEVLITDTVGFIRKLPHHLIDAFRGTLEEAKYADILLHVVDGTNPQVESQMETVYDTLKNLKVEGKPVITAFNKVDKDVNDFYQFDNHADKVLAISARTGQGLADLKLLIAELLRENLQLLERVIPYEEAHILQYIRKYGTLLEEEYRDNGIYVKAYLPEEWYQKCM